MGRVIRVLARATEGWLNVSLCNQQKSRQCQIHFKKQQQCEAVKQMIHNNRRIKTDEIASELSISHCSLFQSSRILQNVSALLISRFSCKSKDRMVLRTILRWYDAEGGLFQTRIVTVDETLAYHFKVSDRA